MCAIREVDLNNILEYIYIYLYIDHKIPYAIKIVKIHYIVYKLFKETKLLEDRYIINNNYENACQYNNLRLKN